MCVPTSYLRLPTTVTTIIVNLFRRRSILFLIKYFVKKHDIKHEFNKK